MVDKQHQINKDQTEELKGSIIDDPYLSHLAGVSENRQAASSGIVYTAVEKVVRQLFPHHNFQSPDPEFVIKYKPDPEIEKYFNNYLYRDKHKFPAAESFNPRYIKRFFDNIARRLFTDNVVYYAIDWEESESNSYKLMIPVRFRLLPMATIKIVKDVDGVNTIRQKYSLFGPPNLRNIEFSFSGHEILHITYPFRENPIVKSKILLSEIQKAERVRSLHVQAITSPNEYSLPVEWARYRSTKQLLRQVELLRAKIRKAFKLPVDHWYGNETQTTEFYKGYRLTEFQKYLNEFRNHLIKSFNEQVMQHVAKINSLPEIPTLQYNGNHPSSEKIDELFSSFKAGEITYRDLYEKLSQQ